MTRGRYAVIIENMDLPKIEQKILKFWKRERIFEKSLVKTKKGPRFVFYEGPPFANGLPGIHHLLSRAFKDIIVRYKTMGGFFVERKAGWDTHGLPTELEAEKKLGVKSKKDIEKIGLEKFIDECQKNVFTYKKEWEDFTDRIGFWLDLKNAYMTCSNDYIESLWWILKQIWDKGLLYQGYKVVPYCPRCGTSLSSHEVAQGYKTIKEKSVYIKFLVKGQKDTYFLVWTTTPWTLPGNVALAVNPKFTYVKVRVKDEDLILVKEKLGVLDEGYKVIEEIKGKDLVGLKYEALFKFIKPDKSAYRIIAGDFISREEGTGIVHIAPAFGEDDMQVGQQNNLPVLMTVDEAGRFKKEVKPWAGQLVKDTDPEIIEDFKKRGLLYKEELYEHDYPFCWRCDTPLLYYAKTSWFIKTTAVKKELLANNQKIIWAPKYIKEGRFGEWLKEVKDWNLSRERYWGTPLPIWECQKCKKQICIGSIEELQQLIEGKKQGLKIDLHRPYIDKIVLKCECGGKMKRIPEVGDCWFDSGAMPWAQWHYPFENQSKVEQGESFPADFICEGIDQTRGWFYTLLAVSTLLGLGHPYRNVISHGLVLDTQGKKMSKSRGNIVWPLEVVGKYGADVARFYFYTINAVGEPKRFDFKDVQDLSRRFFDTLWNVFMFFKTYTDWSPHKSEDNPDFRQDSKKSLLDHWIISRCHNLNQQVIENLDKYDVVGAARLFEDFVNDLSNWYVRRSRKRFQKPETKKEKEEACQTLVYLLLNLSKLLAPFTPFISEEIYRNLTGRRLKSATSKSVHLCDYPKPNKKFINQKLEEKMREVREIVVSALAQRAAAGIKVRQPLLKLKIKSLKLKIEQELLDLIKDEVNVKEVVFDKKIKKPVELETKVTPKLKEEGMIRDLIRQIQQMRKDGGCKPKDKIYLRYTAAPSLRKLIRKWQKFIQAETSTGKIEEAQKRKEVFLVEKEMELDKKKIWLGIKKL